jgi:glycolate oxidase
LKLYPKPEAELSPSWAFDDYDDAYRCVGALARAGVATFAGGVLFDEWKVAYLRRDDEAYITQPADVRALVCAVMYGYAAEVRPAGRRLFRIAKDYGARYLGDEISEGDWDMWVKAKRDIAAAALRHGGSISACHGSCREGEVDLVPQELGGGFTR